jgi:acyl-CoA thioester hydrolase
MILTADIDVRFRDLDAMGHVNNAVVITYFEEGRKQFFTVHQGGRKADGFNFILARVECEYRSPILLKHHPRLEVWVSEIGRKSFRFAYRLRERGEPAMVFATGASVQVCYDYGTQQTMPVDDGLRRHLEAYRGPAA